ncbi:MAG: YgiQ family radical SAM protein [Bacteroidaceae bacterium]|nr:YgiQ family radical SAM protein [Bacteroidaceae bacterium]
MGGWLPTTVKECERLGWNRLDVILFSGDAYVDHPSFGSAVIGRVLEAHGYRVAIVPQPNWQDDLRDFRKLGAPRLFFGVSAGSMDSMVNRYTAGKRLRSEDAYTPDGRHTGRPEYPSIVYTKALKRLFPDIPVVLGGIEASMRRFTHYDYWQDKLLPSILELSGADFLIYGMGEKPIVAIADALSDGRKTDILSQQQVGFICKEIPGGVKAGDMMLAPHEVCLEDKRRQAANFRIIEEESNKIEAGRIIQPSGKRFVVVNPPYPPMTTEELDAVYDLPYTRLPHPRYKGKRIPAYEMIRHSVTIHRGCYGGCSFCTISAHQGKQIVSRSKESIIRELRQITRMEDFKGYVSDLGGPSANMYGTGGRDKAKCLKCKRPTCLTPKVCPNLNTDLTTLTELYKAADNVPGVKKTCIGSGIRYDILQYRDPDPKADKSHAEYARELITRHVSGRLKVAPEHTSDSVLQLMRKPPFIQFEQFKKNFDRINRECGLNQQLIPYFISSHPGCTEQDMALLAVITKQLNFKLEQIQDFTPTPMTLSTEIFYTGIDPYTMKEVYTARTDREKQAQRQFFFWYDRTQRSRLIAELKRIGRPDLIPLLFR